MSEYSSLNLLIVTKKKEIAKYTSAKNAEIKPLIAKRDKLAKNLYTYMVNNGLDSYAGISIEQVSPKEKRTRVKSQREKQMDVLRQMGIRNPQEALKEMGL